MSRTLDQERAKHAYERVQKVKNLAEDQKKAFGREAKKMPVRILTSSLGAAILFLKSKDRALPLVEAVGDWLERQYPSRAGPSKELLLRIVEGDQGFLQLATAEALAYLQWLTRFAEAEGLVGEE